MSMLEKLAYLKHRDHLTTDEIAARSDIPIGTLNKIFAGQTHSPSLPAMHGLCRVFNVPFCFLMEDEVPNDCNMMAYAESRGMFLVSESELEFLEKYRRLHHRERKCIESCLNQYIDRMPKTGQVEAERLIPCYQPIARGRKGVYTDTWNIKTICVPVDAISQDADFSLVVFSDELAPFYEEGDILAIQRCNCLHGQLGVFLLNRELFICRLNCKNRMIKLVPLKSGNPVLSISHGDDLTCLGLVTGILRRYMYI